MNQSARRSARMAFIAALLAAGVTSALAGETRDVRHVHGRVVDESGRPVAGVQVGTHWTTTGGAMTPQWKSDAYMQERLTVRSDDQGRFDGPLYFDGRPLALLAIDVESRRGGTAILNPNALEDEFTLTIAPLVRLTGEVRIALPLLADNTVRAFVFDPRAPIAVASAVIEGEGEWELFLPPGRAKLSLVAAELERAEIELDLAAEHVNTGPVTLQPTALAKLYGQEPPPWTITEARGLDAGVQIADFKGKWLLIETWSYW